MKAERVRKDEEETNQEMPLDNFSSHLFVIHIGVNDWRSVFVFMYGFDVLEAAFLFHARNESKNIIAHSHKNETPDLFSPEPSELTRCSNTEHRSETA